jgi:hypothetical protein
MSIEKATQGDERRQRKDRRKSRMLPYLGTERRKYKIVREAYVAEIAIPPLKVAKDRRDKS